MHRYVFKFNGVGLMFWKTLKPALILMCFFTIFLGLVYPLFIYGIGQVFFNHKANGSLYYNADQKVIGSALIGQNFTRDEYFHPRPSCAGPQGYDASASSGSNLGPTSSKLNDLISERMQAYRSTNKIAKSTPVPSDAVTSSGSGLDPDISIENALLQMPRVASARKLSQASVDKLLQKYTRKSFFTGHSARINVLQINLALDALNAENKSSN